MDRTTIERLLPFLSLEMQFVGTSSVASLVHSYAERRGRPITVDFAQTYPIDRQALRLGVEGEDGDSLHLAWPDHPNATDFQGLHAFAHLLLGDQIQDDPEAPPSHLTLTDPHERDVSTLAVMLLIVWEAFPSPPRMPLWRWRRAPALPAIDPKHVAILLDYFDARIAYSLPQTPRSFSIGDPRNSGRLLSRQPVALVQRMTADLRAGRGDQWDAIAKVVDETLDSEERSGSIKVRL